MSTTTARKIDWETITADYGDGVKTTLENLLKQADIDDEDAAAVVIAALFISQQDIQRAFSNIDSVFDQNRNNLSEDFRALIEQLRGIVAFAKEHVVEVGREQAEKHKTELLEVVKAGIKKAIIANTARISQRSTASTVSLIIGVAASCVLSGLGTALVFKLAAPKVDNSLLDLNKDQIQYCLENKESLGNRCAIDIP